MKENVLDVLMYLFETYVDAEDDPEPDQNELRIELGRAGFGDTEIDRALDWLDGLTDQQKCLHYGNQTSHGTRVYNDFEHEHGNEHVYGNEHEATYPREPSMISSRILCCRAGSRLG